MNKTGSDASNNDRFLDALFNELMDMSDSDVIGDESEEDLLKYGDRILTNARAGAGRRRLANAKSRLNVVHSQDRVADVPVADARNYLRGAPLLTLAARDLSQMSDEDVLRLYRQAKDLEEASNRRTDAEDAEE